MNSTTKIAVTVWGNRISPVFDSAKTLLIADVKDGCIYNKSYQPFDPTKVVSLVRQFETLGISTLVCGAISTQPAQILVDHQIHLVSFVMGNVYEFLESYTGDRAINKSYIMPGCSDQTG